ncbi:MAG TPA: valine--tRNA ligase [Thermoanaerobaculia bacterium]|nr:valine--tRNA ligase [Thermoanaerobaculia bacterium]
METVAEGPSTRLEKTFDPAHFEERWYRTWEAEGRFQPVGPPGSPRFVMVIPPPNVTGRLHIGHAFGRTLEDVLARWKRMLGYRVLWVPGTDHAGIATQMVIERELAKQGIDKRDLGRQKFVERVWAWKRDAKDTIQSQIRRLGCSLDWTRERFTLDPDLSAAVRHAFVRLYRDGLIYRGRYVVNWCPRCGTAVSDLEVVHEEVDGSLYRIRYDVPGVASGAVVATTRPETMLGDTALAIHPDDPRTAKLRGRTAILPIIGRELPIIEDPVLVDREFGTGIVKVTPAHDANDFATAERHGLARVVVIGPDAKMTAEAGEYAGLDRLEARRKVIERLQSENRLVGIDPHRYALGHCQRCDTVIEPYLSTQWFVKIQPLAEPAIRAVEAGEVRFVPELWTKTYFEWMRNIHDWCISRQLWWGHRIPAFTCANGHLTVSEEDPPACPTCGSAELTQDPDVLDTWFSSQLWPFSVLGWPKETEDMREFYPTDVLVTGYDILFFWVARMIMAGIHFTGSVPFSTVNLHGLVRLAGEKMSKTRGNVIDPLVAISEFGADALRFTYASSATSGTTVTLERERLSGSRNFATKIWNAARFTLSQIEGRERADRFEGRDLTLPDRWILSRLSGTADDVNRHLAAFRFDEAAQAIYGFLWHELCDGYLEMVKPVLSGREGDESARETARGVLYRCLADSLALLHPFMPFLTEEIWEKLTRRPGTLIVSRYPAGDPALEDARAEAAVERLRALVTRVRNFRGERRVSPTEPVHLWLDMDAEAPAAAQDLHGLERQLRHLARLSELTFGPAPAGAARDVVSGVAVGLALPAGAPEADRSRAEKTLAQLEKEIGELSGKLQNPAFLDKAPAEVVEKTRRRLVELEERRAALGDVRPE